MAKSAVQEIQPSDTEALRRFMALERKWLGGYPLFYSGPDEDVVTQLSGKSAFAADLRYALFVTSDGERDVARCAAIVNSRYQKAKGEAVGFIGYFAALPGCDDHVAALLQRAEAWLSENGTTMVMAPYNASEFLGSPVLRTEAFDEDLPFVWHPPYYKGYLAQSGYRATRPMMIFEAELTSPAYRDVAQRALGNRHVRVRSVDKDNWDADIETFRVLYNETMRDEWESCPVTTEQFREFFDPMKPFYDTRQLLIAEVDGKPAGLCWGMPDWTPLVRSLEGKSGTEWEDSFRRGADSYSRAGLIVVGVLPQYRGKGVGQTLTAKLFQRYEEVGLDRASYHIVNADNAASCKLAESFGATGRVYYHGYEKRLA
ncbi:MAG: GNAT family N-acetyltransferase [Chloroflexi bacterium]|nr:GNAT family N-acetyltransferase [Chloroflexota bacterium]